MPKLLRATEIIGSNPPALEDTGSAASVGLAQVRSAERQYAASKGLSQAAKKNEAEYEAETKAAMAALAAMSQADKNFKMRAQAAKDNSLANSAYAGAVSEYTAKVGERASKTVGANGLPTFDTLTSDAQKIGQDIYAKYGKGLVGDAAAAFNENFNRYLVGHLPSVMETARSQQVEFGKAAVTGAISSIANNVGADKFTNYPNYEAQVQKILSKGIQDGSVAPMEALKLQESVRLANLNNINNTIRINPERAVFELSNAKPEHVGLTKPEYEQAMEYASAQLIKVKEAEAAKIETKRRRQESDFAEQQSKVFNQMKAEIDNRLATKKGIEDIPQIIAASPVPLTREQELNLSTRFTEGVQKMSKETEAVTGVHNAITAGHSLSSFSSEDMNTWYQKTLDGVEQEGGFVGKLVAGANLVKDVPREVQDFTKDIRQALNSSDEQIANVAAQMTENLIRTNPEAVASLTKEEQALAISLASNARYSGKEGAVSAKEIRDAIMYVPADVKKQRISEATNFSKDIDIQSILDDASIGFSDLPGISFEVDNYSKQEVQRMWQNNYIITGRKDLADAMTATQVTQLFGASDITTAMEKSSDVPGFWNWNNNITDTVSTRIMLNPPEMAPGVRQIRDRDVWLRTSLEETVRDILPEHISVDDVIYVPIPALGATRNTKDPVGTQYYSLMYLDDNNVPRHLLMPDGQFATWKVHGDILKQYEARGLKQERQQEETPKTSGNVFKQAFAPPGSVASMIIDGNRGKE